MVTQEQLTENTTKGEVLSFRLQSNRMKLEVVHAIFYSVLLLNKESINLCIMLDATSWFSCVQEDYAIVTRSTGSRLAESRGADWLQNVCCLTG